MIRIFNATAISEVRDGANRDRFTHERDDRHVGGVTLLSRFAVGNAQEKTQKTDEQVGGSNQGRGTQPERCAGARGATVYDSGGRDEFRQRRRAMKQGEVGRGANGAVERNPDGGDGGAKSNPPR